MRDFDWTRVSVLKRAGQSIVSLELDESVVSIHQSRTVVHATLRRRVGIAWSVDGEPFELTASRLGAFRVRLLTKGAGRSWSSTTTATGLDLRRDDLVVAAIRRSRLQMPDAADARDAAVAVAHMALDLDRGLTVQTSLMDSLELLGQRPTAIADDSPLE